MSGTSLILIRSTLQAVPETGFRKTSPIINRMKLYRSPSWSILFALLVGASVGLAAETATSVEIPNLRTPSPGLVCGGQPTQEQIGAAAASGIRTVITLRAEAESGDEWEPEAVGAAGMTYVVIPVSGPADLTKENAARLDAALKEAEGRGPVMVHCVSGNRVGALLALRAAWIQGKTAEEALELGRKAGLTKLEGEVKRILGL